MRIELTPQGIDLLPESRADETYVEQVLGLKHDMDSVPLTRISLDDNGGLLLKLQARPVVRKVPTGGNRR